MFTVTFFIGVCSVCSVEHAERSLRDLGLVTLTCAYVNLIFPVLSFMNG